MTIDEEALTAAVEAYDAERCRLNEAWHGGTCHPMSQVHRDNVRPMWRAAIAAYLRAIEQAKAEPPCKRCGHAADNDVHLFGCIGKSAR